MKFIDLTGQRFGRLVVIERAENDRFNHTQWLCKCVCSLNKTKIISAAHLRQEHTMSCGCLHDELIGKRTFKHGMSKTYLAKIWTRMKQRCNNPEHPDYRYYGGRGIQVCERWQASFLAFREDMGERPTPKHTIERIDNNGNYEPNNCKWATRKEQRGNVRRGYPSVPLLTLNGETHSANKWAEILGIGITTILYRIKAGWSHERALTTPKDAYRNRGKHT